MPRGRAKKLGSQFLGLKGLQMDPFNHNLVVESRSQPPNDHATVRRIPA